MNLEQLRDQLSAVDRQIIELVAERQRLSGEIGALKRATDAHPRLRPREAGARPARLLLSGLGCRRRSPRRC